MDLFSVCHRNVAHDRVVADIKHLHCTPQHIKHIKLL